MPLDNSYTYFYLLRVDQDVTGEAVLTQVLNQMQLPFNLVKNPSESNQELLVVNPSEYFIAIKVGPPALQLDDT